MSHLGSYHPVPGGPPTAYSPWYDESVILRISTVGTPTLQTELHCTIMSESDAAVHIHIGQRGQNVSKKLILAVEETEKTPARRRLQ
jgi:hypothetical protein